jgi:hypothetical protein
MCESAIFTQLDFLLNKCILLSSGRGGWMGEEATKAFLRTTFLPHWSGISKRRSHPRKIENS